MEIAQTLAQIAAGRTDLVVEWLRHGGDPNAADAQGLRLINWCAHHGDVTAVRLLLDRGADVAALGPNFDLHGAAFHGHLRLVDWCLSAGADANYRLPGSGESPLHAALCKANRPAQAHMVRALLAKGADVRAITNAGAELDSFMRDVRAMGETPLHRAAAYGSEDAIDALLAAGAVRDARDSAGNTPLAWASWHLRPDAILRKLCYGPHRIHPDRQGTYDHGSGWMHSELRG